MRGSRLTTRNRKFLVIYSAVILFICILLVVITSLFCIRTVMRIDMDRKRESYNLLLDSYIKAAESTIEMSATNIINEAHNSMSLITFIYKRADGNYIKSTSYNRALLDLTNMTERSSSIVNETVFYVPRTDIILTSSGSYGELQWQKSAYRTMIEDYGNAELKEEGIKLFRSGDGFIISYDMIPYNNGPLAILFMELDMVKLEDYLSGIFETDLDVEIIARYENGDPAWKTAQKFASDADGRDYISARSERLGWTFTLSIPSLVQSDTLGIIPQLGFFTATVVIAFTLISVLASYILLRPVFSITHAIEQTTMGTEGKESYVDVIENISTRQKELDTTLQIVADDVLTNLFSSLLDGKTRSYDTIKNLLSGIKSDFTTTALYVAIAISGKEGIDDTVRLYFTGFNSLNNTTSIIIRRSDDLLAVVLQFNKVDTTIMEAKSKLNILEAELKRKIENIGMNASVSFGYLCHSVMDIPFSFDKATSGDTSTEAGIGTSQRIAQAVKSLLENDFESFDIHMERAVQIETEGKEQEEMKRSLAQILHSFSAEFCGATASDETAMLQCCSEFESNTAGLKDAQEISRQFEIAKNNIIQTAQTVVKKKNNPYILDAMQYIKNNYTSPNLSLVSIAEAIGITPSYLSRLFSENLNTKLIDYITQERVARSMDELVNTNTPIFEIAEKCGFSSSRNYIAAFRKLYCTTPGEYRKENRRIQ